MRILLLLITLLFIGCNPKATLENQTTALKKNQYRATVVQRKKELQKNYTDFFLKIDDKIYFIKINEGYVSPSELLKCLNKEIIVKAELREGPWEVQEPSSIKEGKQVRKARSGPYVVIYKIYK